MWVKKVLVGWPLLGPVLPTSNGNGGLDILTGDALASSRLVGAGSMLYTSRILDFGLFGDWHL